MTDANPNSCITSGDTSVERLRAAIVALDKNRAPADWIASLDPRKRAEAEFHDWTHDPEQFTSEKMSEWEAQHPNMKYYATDRESARHRELWISQNAPGHVTLDYACGRGTLGLMAAAAGASLSIGLDISPASIRGCRQRANMEGLTANSYFLVGDCENTGLPPESIDRIITAGCLHHLDLNYAFPELFRILKPGGRIYAIEALAYNPIIQLYRRLTPHLRTEFETHHILSLRELQLARKYFRVENLQYFHLFSIAVTPFRNSRLFEPLLAMANALDRVVLRLPPISYMAWSFAFELVKPAR